MKLYKLLKDLPTFKAGDLFILKDDGCLWLLVSHEGEAHWKDQVMAYHARTLEKFPDILTEWFMELPDMFLPEPPKIFDVVATSKLANIEVASEDYYGYVNEKKKTKFTWDEAMEITKNLPGGWRLPTRSEWVLLAEEFGQDENGVLDGNVLKSNLNLKSYDHYWSSTMNSVIGAYNLNLDLSAVDPQDYNYNGHGFAMRLVRDKEADETKD